MTDLAALTLMLAQHHRLSDDGRCTCGHQGRLGDMFSAHIAQQVMAAGWRPTASATAPQ